MNAYRLTLAAVLLAAGGARAQQPQHPPHPPDEGFGRFLFPPELVMQQQRAIGLRPDQRTTITKAIQEFQSRVLDLQWRMQDQTQRLSELLDRPTVDQAAALAQVDEVLSVEREMKRAHLGLLIRIKNTLTGEQQARLAAARGEPELR